METRHNIESRPRRALDNIPKYRRDTTRRFRQFRIRFDSAGVKRIERGTQEVASCAPDLQQLSGRSKLSDEFEPPFRIQHRQPVFVLQSKISKLAVGRAYSIDRFLRRDMAEYER
jgi:hypothetical protein